VLYLGGTRIAAGMVVRPDLFGEKAGAWKAAACPAALMAMDRPKPDLKSKKNPFCCVFFLAYPSSQKNTHLYIDLLWSL
jgi:hypothetical protein